ncbi:MAG: class I SAM-dependent methyltransferase [Pseudobdellovibrionaceae bacterium]
MFKALLDNHKKSLALGYSYVRSAQFALQQASLPVFEYILTGQKRTSPAEYQANLQKIWPYLKALLNQDAQNIADGVYPLAVLTPEKSWPPIWRFSKIIQDGLAVARRRNEKKSHDFSMQAQSYLADVPEYYRRNFHFQSDGYLTEQSADIYEHQVEILFAGAAGPMRRLLIPLFKKHFTDNPLGQGLHFLEVGAGTGPLTRFMKLAFPLARITAVDVSDPYLKKAQSRLQDLDRVDFLQSSGEALPFVEEKFDAVYSCFLFHELPQDVRISMVNEGLRVLKNHGIYGMVDSIQSGDQPDLQWALDRFPIDFHEPFYKNYLIHPMHEVLSQCGVAQIETNMGFFSKALAGIKASSKNL